MRLKVLIADDEPEVLLTLREIISGMENVSDVRTASTVKEVYEQVLKTEPDIIFLDIHFPDGSGLELAESLLSAGLDVKVVFVTLNPSFTLDTLKMYSYDYILKPIDESRVIRTIMRLKKQKAKESPDRIFQKTDTLYRLAVKKGKELVLIDPRTIIFLEKVRKKVTIHCREGKYELTDTLERLEKKLSHPFFRCHKSFIVNINFIQKVVPWNENTYQIHFIDTTKEAPLSRRKYDELLGRIARGSTF